MIQAVSLKWPSPSCRANPRTARQGGSVDRGGEVPEHWETGFTTDPPHAALEDERPEGFWALC